MDTSGHSSQNKAASDGTTTQPKLQTVSSAKRRDYINWEDYFMATAFLAAKRSKDPNYQVGACIVTKDRKIVGTGYNGMPNGCHDDEFPWEKHLEDPIQSKFTYVCHAELNAIVNKYFADIKGCVLYVGLFRIRIRIYEYECAKLIIQEGITEVVYAADKNWNSWDNVASRKMFDAAGVTYRKYVPRDKQIVINFP